jgi:SAM-dependent methyltransferase
VRALLSAVVVVSGVACGARPSSSPPVSSAPEISHSPGTHHHDFHDARRWSEVFDDPGRDAWQRPADVVASMEIVSGSVVADIGAGTGYFLPYLSRAVGPKGTVLALDVEPEMVAWIEERARREQLGNVRARVAKPHDPELPPGSVQRILVVDTWHHVEPRSAYARKLAEALAPGGSVFVVDFTKESPHGPPPAARLDPSAVALELRDVGLTIRVASARDPSPFPPFSMRGGPLAHQFVVEGTKEATRR